MMKKTNQKVTKNLFEFLEFKVANLRAIIGGYGADFLDGTGDNGDTGGTGGGPIDPPIHRPQGPI